MIARRRLASLAVTRPAPAPLAVVQRLLAIQAQDPGQARWAVGVRCGATGAEVDQALDDGTIVRTWPMRGTLHLVPAADVRWMLDLLAPRTIALLARRRRELDLDDRAIERAADRLGQALAGTRLDRDQLFGELEAIGESTAGQRGYHLLVHLCLRGLLCQTGASRKGTFVLLDERVPPSEPRTEDQALTELAVRYYTGHGPATDADLSWWSGLPLGSVRRAIALAGDRLRRELGDDGVERWSGSGDVGEAPPAGVHLLPAFDELLLGYRDRTAILDPAHADRVCPGGNGVFRPMAVVDGRVVATWRAAKGAVTFEPFDPAFDPGVAQDAVARVLAFEGQARSVSPSRRR